MKNRLFMVGERRSGTNLLRLMLSQNSQIVAPHMVAMLDKLQPLSDSYGVGTRAATLEQMVDDVRHLIQLVPVAWRGPELSLAAIEPRCKTTSFVSILGAIMELCAEQANVPVWIHKEPKALRWHEQIETELGDVGYIYLYRDPRDVVLSFARIADGDKHTYAIAKHWAELQQLALDALAILPAHKVHSVRYEDLVTCPEQELSRLCEFIGVTYSESMLQFYERDEAKATATSRGNHWGKLNQPVSKVSVSRYLTEMPREQGEMVEFVAGSVMERLGYHRAYPQTGFSGDEIRVFLDENTRAKELILGSDALAHIRAQRRFLEEIRSRNVAKGA